MPVQTSSDYTAAHGAAFEGQRVDLQLTNITSKTCEGSDIAFGRAVVRGTGDDQCKLPSATGQLFLGVTVHTTDGVEQADGDHLYERYRECNILDFGEIWVYTEQSVVPGDAVYFRHTADTAPLDIVGRFRKDASGGDADLIVGAAFTTTTAAGSYAKLKLNTPGTGILIAPDSSNTQTASGVISLTTSITYFDSTSGAQANTLADGTEGQIKKLMLSVDGGDVVITPTNLAVGATLRLTEAFSSYTLQFSGTSWKVIGREGKSVVTITASGAIPLDADIVLLNTTSGAQANTLADGYIGQEIEMRMIVATNNAVLTPTNLEVGATLRNTEVGSSYSLVFTGTSWKVASREGKAIVTVTATSGALPLDADLILFDSTLGASTSSLADGYEGQEIDLKMTVDGGDQVLTPANLLDGTTITYDDAGDSSKIVFASSNWNVIGTPTATVA